MKRVLTATGVMTGAAGSAAVIGWSALIVVAIPVAAALALLAWVLVDADRTRRFTSVIRAARRTR